jgi:hypothetical protein
LSRVTGDDFAREQQLHDFRHAHGLCFKCGDRFSQDRKQGAQLLTIQVGEFGELLDGEAEHALEFLEEPAIVAPEAQCCMLSAQATAGTESSACVCLPAPVQDQEMLLLLDLGSSHSFVTAYFVKHLELSTISIHEGGKWQVHFV